MKTRGNYALLYSPLTLVAISMRANPTIAIQKVWAQGWHRHYAKGQPRGYHAQKE